MIDHYDMKNHPHRLAFKKISSSSFLVVNQLQRIINARALWLNNLPEGHTIGGEEK